MTDPDPATTADHASRATPADQYAELRAAGRPDLDDFLRRVGPLSPGDAAEVFRLDLEARWGEGDRVPAEYYLSRLPAPDSEAAVDLIFSEYVLRERLGERPDPDEYARRFPEHAAVLRDQVAFHRALAAATSPAAGPDATASGSPAPAPTVGQLPRGFGRYTLLRVLGAGGMGIVYLADDTQLGRQVALKVLRLDRGDPAAVGRFRREARLAAGLDHPNLCPVYDVGRFGGIDYLTMPFVSGESLAVRVRRDGPLPEAEAVRLVQTVARAMQTAHDVGVIHRDLKPGNVILTAAGEPVVTDFGLARRAGGGDPRLTGSGAVIGTPAYMPPEQIGSAPEGVGPTADVYSLGVILYELLTGRPPFDGTPGEVLRQVLTADPVPPGRLRPGLDPRMEVVCLRAMAKDPKRRFASMAEFADALARPQAARRIRSAWWIGGTAAAVVIGLGVWVARPPRATEATVPVPPVAPSPPAPTPAADPLPAGSRWVGEFRFAGDPGPPKTVQLTVTERSGERFRGRYLTEGVYHWEVDGTLRDGAIRWNLSKSLNKQAEGTGATGKAYVTGRVSGRDMRVTFIDPTDGSRAEMVLALQDG